MKISHNAEKRAIQSAFSQAAAQYDQVATVQRAAADWLLTHLSTELTTQPDANRVLDTGCGTGYLTEHLARRGAHCTALDLAHSMANTTRAHAHAVCGDIEQLPFCNESFDLYASSLAWQWTHARTALAEAARVLKPRGTLLVATLGTQTLHELREAFAQIDAAEHVREFEPFEHYDHWLKEAGFTALTLQREILQTHAPDLRSLLGQIKTLGAHVLSQRRRKGLLGKNAWRRLQQDYEQWRTPKGLPASYEVIILKAIKKTSPT